MHQARFSAERQAGWQGEFDAWRARVDAAVVRLTGGEVGADDLPDRPFVDWFNAGITPQRAAAKAMRRARG